ncbi:uncharacterized protein LOC128726004 [Anopheles nili]|uniref:uncharacterized protein LOC128726004 n=1 Tax=Anopheles nili TaxID=185578 RepID=UPI00237BE820|nr:uncharacterized protein LOC128726004 [Anopheles nili]
MKRTVDVCYYVRNPNSDRVVKIVYDYVMARSNLPKRCPFPAGDYQAHDIRPSDVKLPPFLPETTLMLEIVYRSEVSANHFAFKITYFPFSFAIHFHAQQLLAVGTNIEFNSRVKSIDLSHTFHCPDSLMNQSIELGINISRPITDMKLQFVYSDVTENGSIRMVLIKRTVDMCFYMRNPSSDRLVKLVYDYVRPRTNLPSRCPVEPGNYYIRDIRSSDVPLPAFLPEASFLFETIYRSEVRRVNLIEFRMYGRLMRFIENLFSSPL